MKKMEVAVKNGRAWVVCPYCTKGVWIDVSENSVRTKARCSCQESFMISFFRRICDRKKINAKGLLKIGERIAYPITLVDLSLQGVGFTTRSVAVTIGQEYDVSFSFSEHTVVTAMRIVSVRGDIVGGQFIFVDEYCSAKLSVRRIWNKI